MGLVCTVGGCQTALALLTLGMLSACSGIDRGSYIEGNERLLDSLPVYPGAKQVGEDVSVGYPAANGQLFPENDSSGGYITHRYYSVPTDRACSQVEYWYGDHLAHKRVGGVDRPDWETLGGPDNDASWGKGSAIVEITCSIDSRQPRLGVTVDYKQRSS